MLDDLLADVAKFSNATESALALITGIVQRFAEAGTDAERLITLGNALLERKQTLADAVVNVGTHGAVPVPAEPEQPHE